MVDEPKPITRAQFQAMIDAAEQETKRLQTAAGQWDLFDSILRQLEFARQCTQEGRVPTEQERERMQVGVIAVRNFEEWPEYMGKLCDVGYYFDNVEMVR